MEQGKDADKGFIWANLLHMGYNMWSDRPCVGREIPQDEKERAIWDANQADWLRFDEGVWRRITGRMAKMGMNMVVIDIGEAIIYPSHPELAVEGSWTPARMKAELARLRGIGLEPIPKLNFSTTHDSWLKEYGRMVSTPEYYRVCEDVIRDVCAIFDKPRFFHLGFDEERASDQPRYDLAVARQGALFWHDLKLLVDDCERYGTRAWIWSDQGCRPDRRQDFLKNVGRNVLLSNWYYELDYGKDKNAFWRELAEGYALFEKDGYDQIPCGTNYYKDANFGGLVKYCDGVVSPQRLKGYLMAPWKPTLPVFEAFHMKSLDLVEAAMKARKQA